MSTKKSKLFCPEPGIYEDVPMATYFTWDAASQSRLMKLKRSPAHAKSAIEGEDQDTPARIFGRAAHAALLEPDVFRAKYATANQCVAHTKDGARCQNNGAHPLVGGKSVCGVHFKKALAEDDSLVLAEGVTILPKKTHAACLTIRERVIAKARAAGLVEGEGRAELSIVWIDPDTGVKCKARIDRHTMTRAGPTIVDVKTTEDASDYIFERDIFRWFYHVQGAMYTDGANEVGLPTEHYVIMPIEKKPPYESSVFRLLPPAIDAGRDLLKVLMSQWAWCKKKNLWPGYPDRVRQIALPDYAWQRTEDIIIDLEERWKATI